MLDDTFFIAPLQKVLSEREAEFTSDDFAGALDTLAHITRNEDDKTEVRIFLVGYVNHPKQDVKAGAIAALGTLGDPKAISIVETFSGDKPDDPIQRTAKDALEKLQEKKQIVPEEIIYLRETVDELKKDSEKLKDDLEDLKKRLDASEESTESDTEDKTDDDKE
jgi:HEAT repeat protein